MRVESTSEEMDVLRFGIGLFLCLTTHLISHDFSTLCRRSVLFVLRVFLYDFSTAPVRMG